MAFVLASGLTVGLTYSMLALGVALVYRTSGYFNMAHGGFALFAAYLGLTVADATNSFWLAVAVSVLGGIAIALAVQYVVIRNLQNASDFSILSVTILLGSMIEQTLQLSFNNGLPVAFPANLRTSSRDFMSLGEFQTLWIAILAVAITAALHLWLKRGRGGLAMRAVGEAPDIAALFGVRVPLVHAMAIAASGALAGFVGLSLGVVFDFLTPTLDVAILFKALMLLLALGETNLWALLIGGVVLGEVEGIVTYWFEASMRDAIAFWLIIAALLLRPGGVFKARKIS